jgi:exodeoxyribonuclease V alpha subunit
MRARRIEAIDEEDRTVSVVFDGRVVIFERADLDELVLAYACSIHKPQGSEYPSTVCPRTLRSRAATR